MYKFEFWIFIIPMKNPKSILFNNSKFYHVIHCVPQNDHNTYRPEKNRFPPC